MCVCRSTMYLCTGGCMYYVLICMYDVCINYNNNNIIIIIILLLFYYNNYL